VSGLPPSTLQVAEVRAHRFVVAIPRVPADKHDLIIDLHASRIWNVLPPAKPLQELAESDTLYAYALCSHPHRAHSHDQSCSG
jgi:hypothetical protein